MLLSTLCRILVQPIAPEGLLLCTFPQGTQGYILLWQALLCFRQLSKGKEANKCSNSSLGG